MGGTAISALTTVKLVNDVRRAGPVRDHRGRARRLRGRWPWLLLRDAPGRVVPTEPLASRLAATARLPITWQACVAVRGRVRRLRRLLRLPAGLPQDRLRAGPRPTRPTGWPASCVARGGDAPGRRLAVRPLRPHPGAGHRVRASWPSVRPSRPSPRPLPAGHASRSCRWPPRSARAAARPSPSSPGLAPPNKVGSVTGLVGAAGGLGGFVPPLVMGAVYGRTGSYASAWPCSPSSPPAALAAHRSPTVRSRPACHRTTTAGSQPPDV